MQIRFMIWVWCALVSAGLCAAELKTRNVVFIVSDGLRWQEVFTGAERRLMTTEGGVKNTNALVRKYWRETPSERREALLPFVWSHIALRGQLLGNQHRQSVVTVSNGQNFSYPGYNEMLTGIPDPRIDSNAKNPNPNVTVFEWINGQRGFRGKVSVMSTWDVFPWIFNIGRSGLPVWPAWDEQFKSREIAVPPLVAAMARDNTPLWDGVIQDAPLFHAVADHLRREQPRLIFVGFGETDEWAHAGRYDLYLHAAHRVDDYIRRLWEAAQAIPQYRDKTTFIITSDHGRGGGPEDWKHHNNKTPGSEDDWIAVIGPDTPALGERANTQPYTAAQLAATVAALLGHDFRAAIPEARPAIQEILGR